MKAGRYIKCTNQATQFRFSRLLRAVLRVLISRDVFLSLTNSNTFKPFMCQCLACRNSLVRIKVRHGTKKVLKIFVDVPPKGAWCARVVFVETIPSYFKNGNPRTVAKVMQEPTQSVYICKVRKLAFDYHSQGLHTFVQLLFLNVKDDALIHCVYALHDNNSEQQPQNLRVYARRNLQQERKRKYQTAYSSVLGRVLQDSSTSSYLSAYQSYLIQGVCARHPQDPQAGLARQ